MSRKSLITFFITTVLAGLALAAEGDTLWGPADKRVNLQHPLTAVPLGTQDLPSLSVDSYGHSTVVWSSSENIYAQKLNPDGDRIWAAADKQVNLRSDGTRRRYPRVVTNSSGNAYVVWVTYMRGSVQGSLHAQKLSANGDPLWSYSGSDMPIDPYVNVNGLPAIAISTDETFLIAVWLKTGGGIYAQKINASTGRLIWEWGGRRVSPASGSYPVVTGVKIDADDKAVVVWDDPQAQRIYAQKIDQNGNPLWGGAGVIVNQESVLAHPRISLDSSGNAFISWATNSRVLVQKIGSLNGYRMWRSDAVINTISSPANSDIAVDRAGNAIVVMTGINGSILAQKIDSDGNMLWRTSPLTRVRQFGRGVGIYPLVGIHENNAVVIWMDTRDRVGFNFDIYAQKIIAACLGPEPGLIEPSRGNRGASLPVTIYGDNLSGATLSNDCGISIERVVSNRTQMDADFILTSARVGSCNIAVTTCGGSAPALTFSVHTSQASGPPRINAQYEVVDVLNGGIRTLQIEGSNLNGNLSVSIPTERPPGDERERVFPRVYVEDNDPFGRWMRISMDATDGRILDFYNLVVDNGVGSANVIVRVLHREEPIADAWSPAQPRPGRQYVLTIVGRNLQGARVYAEEPNKLEILHIRTEPERIVGILSIDPLAPNGDTYLVLENESAGRRLKINICGACAEFDEQSTIDVNLMGESKLWASDEDYLPELYFQEGDGAFAMREEISEAMPAAAMDYMCWIDKVIGNFHWELPLIFCPERGSWGNACLRGLNIGDRVRVGGLVLTLYLRVEMRVWWHSVSQACIPSTWPRFCIMITAGAEIVNRVTEAVFLNYCLGRGERMDTNLGRLGSLTFGSGACTSIIEQDGSPRQGISYATVEYTDCCADTITMSAEGTSFRGLVWRGISMERNFNFHTIAVAHSAPAGNCQVVVTEVDLCANRIRTMLNPIEAAGEFTLNVIGPGRRTTLVRERRQGGNYEDEFLVEDLPVGRYTEVEALWSVGDRAYRGTRPYPMEVLENRRITCYNTPLENDFSGSPVVAGAANDRCQWGSRRFIRGFLEAVNRNGSGVDNSNTMMQIEGHCRNAPRTSPPYCGTERGSRRCRRYRRPIDAIRTSCGNTATEGVTAAVPRGSRSLECGDDIFIEGFGCRTVQDVGDPRVLQGIDIYGGIGRAICKNWENPTRKIVKINAR